MICLNALLFQLNNLVSECLSYRLQELQGVMDFKEKSRAPGYCVFAKHARALM